MTAVEAEAERAKELLSVVDDVAEVAETLPSGDPRRSKLMTVIAKTLAAAPPVRPVVAAELLGLSDKTVRAWAREGVLVILQDEPRVLLDARRLYEVVALVHDLREAGRTRGLLDEVWQQLSDRALLDRDDLTESLEQMRRGEGRIVRPRPAG
ncbi:MAG TPA: hypothetical protein VMF87_25875 [Streptosporangiaceae bacterium]|nr:hypothetical protein [Streptosporangiaceae bacterium]